MLAFVTIKLSSKCEVSIFIRYEDVIGNKTWKIGWFVVVSGHSSSLDIDQLN